MGRAESKCVSVGAALLAEVDELSQRERRSRSSQIVHLCELALNAPEQPRLEEDRYLDGDATVRARLNAEASFFARVEARARAQGEDFSEAVRALLVGGLVIARGGK